MHRMLIRAEPGMPEYCHRSGLTMMHSILRRKKVFSFHLQGQKGIEEIKTDAVRQTVRGAARIAAGPLQEQTRSTASEKSIVQKERRFNILIV